jgi:hypothetical protein
VYRFVFKLKKIKKNLHFESYNFFPKSKKGIEKWTFLKMSKNENPKKVLKNTLFFTF